MCTYDKNIKHLAQNGRKSMAAEYFFAHPSVCVFKNRSGTWAQKKTKNGVTSHSHATENTHKTPPTPSFTPPTQPAAPPVKSRASSCAIRTSAAAVMHSPCRSGATFNTAEPAAGSELRLHRLLSLLSSSSSLLSVVNTEREAACCRSLACLKWNDMAVTMTQATYTARRATPGNHCECYGKIIWMKDARWVGPPCFICAFYLSP